MGRMATDLSGSAWEDVFDSVMAMTSVGAVTLRMLETLLPAAAQDVEREGTALGAHFTVLAEYCMQHNPPPEIKATIEAIIIGMQFQDRNTQVMENAASMLERYRKLLEDVSHTLKQLQQGKAANEANVSEALDIILSGIRLSDIRAKYLEALRKANIHAEVEEEKPANKEMHSIELF